MKKLSILTIFLFAYLNASQLTAQSYRTSENNSIGWYAAFLTYNLNDKWSIHGEFQWRRTEIISEGKQNLYRTGINYKIHPNVILRSGFAYIDTYPYGKIPIQSAGKTFPEYRTYQMAQVSNPLGNIMLTHRFMLEQRWVGIFTDSNLSKSDDQVYLNRARYMARLDIPLGISSVEKKVPYLAVYDEMFIGFGKNVNQNIFDQNRIGLLIGHKFNKEIRSEIGFISQTVQFGRLINAQEYMQYNNGLIWNTYITL
ncbi:long-chain fatty acid transport protein [Belliella baltica DSM 15883]|uniref:Long-chain fatty acid transport protein n=1 Tax=Belliella baltica (strain DSM 15883 / CIP 108006 / LMG 21964 / BA134) TaxID=866536 RepID=I3Z721_BELBD|nr:DUF2490 domain-containing protein [Belliella baltica]AFL85039.1 long-chain fatty acid transport protein [Belliella baltica DSM 15883]